MKKAFEWWKKIGLGKQKGLVEPTRPEGRVEIDTDVFPRIGHHVDYSRKDEQGNLEFHATLSPRMSPTEISGVFADMANSLEKNPPANLSEGELAELVKALRGESKSVPGVEE